MAEQTYRVLIVDDHPIVREGLDRLLSREEDLVVCGQAEDAPQALDLLESARPDLAIVDISLASGSGLDLVRQMRAESTEIQILVSSMHDETLYAERALRAGARGYINKQQATEKIVEALRRIVDGRIYLSERMTDRLLSRVVDASEDPKRISVDRLSNRELQVLELIGNGMGTAEIAQRMNLSVKTVETYRQRIRQKLSLKNGAALASFASQWVLEEAKRS
jgi:DNA-binding NarL/FixJ family response regulator